MDAASRRSVVSSAKRLARDIRSLYSEPLPLYYLWPSSDCGAASLNSVDILLAGPPGTPYSSALFRLHLDIPPTYPAVAPRAFFRTAIFHPNVDPRTGAVCLETLKRDWRPELTLRDVLATLACLLIHPNPDSALNEDAGRLLQQADYTDFEDRARLMAGIHARVPAHLREAVDEAVRRGDQEPIILANATERPDGQSFVTSDRVRGGGGEGGENSEEIVDDADAVGEPDGTDIHEDKENDAALSPTPVVQSPPLPVRTGVKRPLGEMMVVPPSDKENENENEKNIAANVKHGEQAVASSSKETGGSMVASKPDPSQQRHGLVDITDNLRLGAPPAKKIATGRARVGIRRL